MLAPVLTDKQVNGLVELWIEPVTDGTARRELARFLTEMAGFVAAYFQKNQLQSLLQQQQLWTQLEAFSRQIHSSLEPTTVAQWVANEGRRLLACDQLSVAIRWSTTVEVTAISGASSLERNSRLVQTLQTLCEAVLEWGDKLVYQGKRDASLPVAVVHALDAYLAESNATTLVVLPLNDGHAGAEAACCCALVAESHDPALPVERLLERMQTVATHAGPALVNARHVARMPLHKLSRSLAAVRDWSSQRRLARLGLCALPLLLLVGVLTFVPIPLRLEAKGQLLPIQEADRLRAAARQDRRTQGPAWRSRGQGPGVAFDGRPRFAIANRSTRHQSRLGRTAASRASCPGEQLGKSTNNEERNALTKDRINQEYEMRKAMAERDILLQGSRSPRKSPILAPLAGKLVTFDMQEQLLGKTVKPGDSLLRVAAVNGAWEIELQIPERNLGPIREGLRPAVRKVSWTSICCSPINRIAPTRAAAASGRAWRRNDGQGDQCRAAGARPNQRHGTRRPG